MRKFTKFEYMDQRFYTRFRRGEGIIAMREIKSQNASDGVLIRKGELYHVSDCFYDEEYQCEFVKLIETGPNRLFTLDYFDPCEPSFGMVMGAKIESIIEFEHGL